MEPYTQSQLAWIMHIDNVPEIGENTTISHSFFATPRNRRSITAQACYGRSLTIIVQHRSCYSAVHVLLVLPGLGPGHPIAAAEQASSGHFLSTLEQDAKIALLYSITQHLERFQDCNKTFTFHFQNLDNFPNCFALGLKQNIVHSCRIFSVMVEVSTLLAAALLYQCAYVLIYY